MIIVCEIFSKRKHLPDHLIGLIKFYQIKFSDQISYEKLKEYSLRSEYIENIFLQVIRLWIYIH